MAIVSGTQKAKREAARAVAQFNGIICAFCGLNIYTRWNVSGGWISPNLTNELEEDSVIEHFEQAHPEEAAMFVLGGSLDMLRKRVKEALVEKKKTALKDLSTKGYAVKILPKARKYHFVDVTGSARRGYRASEDYAVCGELISERLDKWNKLTYKYDKIMRERDIVKSWSDIDTKKKCVKCKRFLGEAV